MPISRSLPDKPQLEQLRRQAKELHRALHRGDPLARTRLHDRHPRAGHSASAPKLSDAQLVLAREHGFGSWPELVEAVSAPSARFKEALRDAVETGTVNDVRELLDEHPALLDCRFAPHADTPLHLAVTGDHADVVELLVERGAALDAKNSWGGTPLVAALIRGKRSLAERLIAHGAKATSLVAAAGIGDLALLRSFFDDDGKLRPGAAELPASTELEPGAWHTEERQDDVQTLQDALEYACRNGRTDAAEWLLRHGADVDGHGFFGAGPLHWASAQGTPDVIRLLVRHGAALERRDPTFQSTPFGWACEHDKEDNMRALRESGYRPDVWEAARCGDVDLVRTWVDDARPLLDAVRWGTPLCEAAAWNRPQVVRWLLSAGATPSIPSRDGKTPLQLAEERGHASIVALLRDRPERRSGP